ncbi:hypothetical protein [Nesterenkonia pannonica]|nr:hypothetical protein [Nesterenkonia pannonica]
MKKIISGLSGLGSGDPCSTNQCSAITRWDDELTGMNMKSP